jgi:type IV secretory pathway VirB4 component
VRVAERRAQFEEAGASYESSYFLTFPCKPPVEGAASAERILYEDSNRTVDADAREILRGFVDRTNRTELEGLFQSHSCLIWGRSGYDKVES